MFGWSKAKREPALETTRLKIEGMSCGGCVRHVTAALQALPGVDVKKVEVGSATVSWNAGQTSEEALIGALSTAGYAASREDVP